MSYSKPELLLAQELSCPICLQLFSDPVVLPCGHNYCLACIRQVCGNDRNADTGTLPRCPECREEYKGIDTLQKNFKLCGIIKGYQATALTIDDRSEPRQTTVLFCDHCIDGDMPAVKTCLTCQVSLCSRHLQKHHEKELFRVHSLVEPRKALGMSVCVAHTQPLEYYCSSDMTLLCATCFMDGLHQNHEILTFDAAAGEMRRALENRNKVISDLLQMTDNLLKKAGEEQDSETIGDKLANKAVTLMDNMAALVDRKRLNVLLEEERGQRNQSWKSDLLTLEKQQQHLLEIQDRATNALNESDTCLFIHRFRQIDPEIKETISGSLHTKLPSRIPLNTRRLHEGLRIQDFCAEVKLVIESLNIIFNPLEFTFSLATAHPNLILSSDLRTIKYSTSKQPYGDHAERFTSAPQVLCTMGFSGGQHVWVVEVGEHSMWSLGLCYKSIPRRGDNSRLGHNAVSWRLQSKNRKLSACHASSTVALGETTNHLLRIEVALDYEGGTLAFHCIKGCREHLYTFRATFRELVYPAFSIHSTTKESWITLQSGL